MLCATTLRVAFSWHGWGKFTLRASEGKFGAFVTEFENGRIQWNSGRVEGKWAERIYCKLKYRGCNPDTLTADGKADRNSARFVALSAKGL
ncbi:MAG: hypothetical protein V8T22_05355 [Oscillospiraceae bacterium]